MHIKRRSHCVCPNCLSGLNSGSGNVQQRSHSCHYPGCGKVYYTIKLLQTPMYKPHLFPHQPAPFSTWFYMVGREDKRTNNRKILPALKKTIGFCKLSGSSEECRSTAQNSVSKSIKSLVVSHGFLATFILSL